MKKLVYPTFVIIVFLFMQASASAAIMLTSLLENEEMLNRFMETHDTSCIMETVSPALIGLSVVVSGTLTVVVISLLKMIEWRNVFNPKTIDMKTGLIGILGAMAGIFSLNIAAEMLELPDLMEKTFTNMSASLFGALSIGVFGPILEELIFREGIEGYMLRNGVNKWTAIIASALIFGVVHLNPAQIPFAAAMGVILGILYYKSGNIILTSILHIINNSISVYIMYALGDKAADVKIVDQLGGTGISVASAAAGIVVCAIVLRYFWKQYKTTINNETVL